MKAVPVGKIKEILSASKSAVKLIYNANRLGFVVRVIAGTLSSLTPLVTAYFAATLLDRLIDVIRDGQDTDYTAVYTNVGLLIVLILIGNIVSKLTTLAYQKMALFLDFYMDKLLMEKISGLDIPLFEDPKTNNEITKMSRNAYKVIDLTNSVVFLIPDIVILAISTLIFLKLSPVIVFIVFITTLPGFFENIVYGKRVWGIWDTKTEIVRDYNNNYSYLTVDKYIGELRIYNLKDFVFTRAVRLYETFLKEQLLVESKRLNVGVLFSVISAVGNGLVILIISFMAISLKITIGSVSFYIQNARSFANAVDGMYLRTSQIISYSIFVKDFFALLSVENKILPGSIPLPHSDKPPLIEFKNVTFAYPNTSTNVLENFNLVIKPGEHLAIVGKNGAGKSTLIKLLMRFYEVDDGDIFINSISIKDLNLTDLYSHIATLFQVFNTYHFDAKTNIGIGNLAKIDSLEDIYEASEKSGADDFIQKYEHKYDQVLSKKFTNGIEPSHGQWQKIALARAFFKDAEILILDEPTSAIDPKAEAEIFERLFTFAQDKSVIIISHRFSTVRNAKVIVVLDEGKIVEKGSHEELMEIDNGIYKTTFEIQKRGYE